MPSTTIRPDLLSPDAPEGVEVLQLTSRDLPSSHVYMEAQVFSPDSTRFVLHESATPHGGDKDDPKHRYLICDLEDNGSLRPITDEVGATAPSVSPDGRYLYYFVDETEPNAGRLTLKRVGFDGTDRQTLLVLDTPLPDSAGRASRPYVISTIRSDGRRIALSCYLGDGNSDGQPGGLMVFDLDRASVEVILSGPSWCNVHAQYSRSTSDDHMREILVQQNHGDSFDRSGELYRPAVGNGADIHVITDDGKKFMDMPWGRDGNEFCQGHQCWRGQTAWAIAGTATKQPAQRQLIESRAVEHTGHAGIASPGGIRNHLSRSFPDPCFCHFGTDREGTRLVTDAAPEDQNGPVFIAELHEPGQSALSSWTHLASPRSSWRKDTHVHPFLSPDGTKAFFNSDESGILQAYMIRGLEAL